MKNLWLVSYLPQVTRYEATVMDHLWFRIEFNVRFICYCTFIRIWSCFITFFLKILEKASEIRYTCVSLSLPPSVEQTLVWLGCDPLLVNIVHWFCLQSYSQAACWREHIHFLTCMTLSLLNRFFWFTLCS